MLRRTFRAHWMPIFAVASLLVAGLYFWLGLRGGVPPDGGRVFYPAVMLYNYTAAPLAILIMLIALTVAVMWVPQALHRLPRFRLNGLMAGLALLATGLACWGSLPQLYVTYRHIDRAVLDGRVYQMGARFALDEDNFVVLCECDRTGLICRCQRLAGAAPRVRDELPRLVVDQAARTVAVELAGQTLYFAAHP